jgi:hypothetical protein
MPGDKQTNAPLLIYKVLGVRDEQMPPLPITLPILTQDILGFHIQQASNRKRKLSQGKFILTNSLFKPLGLIFILRESVTL